MTICKLSGSLLQIIMYACIFPIRSKNIAFIYVFLFCWSAANKLLLWSNAIQALCGVQCAGTDTGIYIYINRKWWRELKTAYAERQPKPKTWSDWSKLNCMCPLSINKNECSARGDGMSSSSCILITYTSISCISRSKLKMVMRYIHATTN